MAFMLVLIVLSNGSPSVVPIGEYGDRALCMTASTELTATIQRALPGVTVVASCTQTTDIDF